MKTVNGNTRGKMKCTLIFLVLALIASLAYGASMQIRSAYYKQLYLWSIETQGTYALFLSTLVREGTSEEWNRDEFLGKLRAFRAGNAYLRESIIKEFEDQYSENERPEIYYRLLEEDERE